MPHQTLNLTFPFSHTPFGYKYVWIFFLLMGLTNSYLGWRSLLTHIQKNEVLKSKYRLLFTQYAIWTNLPWIVMGLGILLGEANGVLDYLVPSSGNLAVMIWWGLFFLMNYGLVIWIFFAGGAEKLEKYPGLPTILSGSAASIRVVTSIGFILLNLLAVFIYFFNPWAHDGRVYSTRILLDFPFYFSLFFVLFWLLGGWIFGQFSGWVSLARFYSAKQKYEGPLLRWRSAKLNWVHYHTCLNLGANQEGLYISMNYFFKIHHRNLFIPWSDIQTVKGEMIWGNTLILNFAKSPKILLEIHEKTVSLLKEMANNTEAFKGMAE
jgi:hypothetical protein